MNNTKIYNITEEDVNDTENEDKKDIEEDDEESELNSDICVTLINIFIVYYNKINNKTNILDDIDTEDPTSTNKILESFYEYVDQYKENDAQDTNLTKVYDPNTNIYADEKIFCLMHDGVCVKISPTLLSLLMFLVKCNWTDLNWKIMTRI